MIYVSIITIYSRKINIFHYLVRKVFDMCKNTFPTDRSKMLFMKKSTRESKCFFLEASPGFEPGNKGFADLCLTTWL